MRDLGVQVYSNTGEIFGIPIKHSSMSQDFGFIVERIQSRLVGWKANLLSFIGRLVLTQSVITTVPNYAMQCVALLTNLHSVDKLSQNFLWGSIDNKKKLHMVSWKKITKPKREGGLGIHAAKAKNIAFLAKLNWRLKTEMSSLWAKVLNHKNRVDRRPTNAYMELRTCSNTWSMIRKGKVVFKRGSKWVVGRDSQLSLWYDKWLDKGPLRSLISSLLNRGEENIRLKEIANFSGWNWQNISFSLLAQLLSVVKATPIPFFALYEDHLTWYSSPSGAFELKEAYRLAGMEGEDNQASPFVGEWIWKTISILKVKCFLWQCYHNSIPVQATLAYRGMDISPSCLICNGAPETIIHVLRDCPFAKWFWNSFPQPMQASLFYGSRLADWMRLNCQSTKVFLCSRINWGVVFPFGIWGL